MKSILYRIRNGKAFATQTEKYDAEQRKKAKRVLDIVLDSIVKDIEKNVNGKKIYIPDYINYTLPATEKQFTGDFPSGTYISISKDMIVGIHWENQKGHRIDLDLSMLNATAGKIGWDASYRTEDRNILFSGDVTDAKKPKGASELFYVRKQRMESFILFLNYYNYDEKIEVPFKIIVAKEKVGNFKENYIINPNNVISIVKSKIDQKQKMLGLLVVKMNECRFYFAETNLGVSITSSGSEFADNARKYLFDFYKNAIGLKDVLEKAGAEIITDKERVVDINLSPEDLEKGKIIELLN